MNHLIETLQRYRHWVCWKKEEKAGKATKVPYVADTHHMCASVSNPATWRPYREAALLAGEGRYSGVGFVLGGEIPYVCIDLDHCIDRVTGELMEPAAAIVKMVQTSGGTYIEISPSGEGLHVWGRYEGITLPGGKPGIRKNGIEIYRNGRYITVTGNAFDDSPLGDLTSTVQEIVERYGLLEKPAPSLAASRVTQGEAGKAAPEDAAKAAPPEMPAMFDDDFLLEKARTAKNGSKFSALFDTGDTSLYGDDASRADAALLEMLAYWTNGNAGQMERLFMKSVLGSPERLSRKKHKDNGYIRNISIPNVLKDWRARGANHYELKGAILISREEPGRKAPPDKPAGKEDVLSLEPKAWTDTANAERIAAWYGHSLKFCPDYDSFVEFTGKCWKKVPKEKAYQYANRAMNRIRWTIAKEREALAKQEQEALARGDEAAGNAIEERRGILDGLEKRTVANKNFTPIDKAIKILRGLNTCEAVEFDATPYVLNCDNGLLNLATGELVPHNPAGVVEIQDFRVPKGGKIDDPAGMFVKDTGNPGAPKGGGADDLAHMCMKCTGVSYVKNPKSHLWKDTVAAILPDEATRHYLQKVLGSSLQGKVVEQEVYFLVGHGGNGKGIITESVKAALGDYARTISPEIILTSRNGVGAGDKATPTIVSLIGVRLAICGESDLGRTLNAGMLKRLTGGDTLTGREVYGKKNIEFRPTHAIVFSTNYEPAIEDACDQALKRRVRVILFTETFSEEKGNMDVHLSEKLKAKEVKEEILSWLVEGYTMYRREGLTPPAAVRKATAKFFDSNDYIGDFIASYCEIGEDYKVEQARLYSLFQRVCRDEYGQDPMSARAFNQVMVQSHGFKKVKRNGARCLLGIKLKTSHVELVPGTKGTV